MRSLSTCALAGRLTLGVLLLAGCSRGTTTKPGPLGEKDLSAILPSGVTVPPDAKSFEAAHEICASGKGDTPIQVRVRWKAFTSGGASFVSSYSVELVKSVPGVAVVFEREPSKSDHPNANAIVNANANKSDRSLMMATSLVVTCTHVESSKLTVTESPNIYIRADGASSTKPVW